MNLFVLLFEFLKDGFVIVGVSLPLLWLFFKVKERKATNWVRVGELLKFWVFYFVFGWLVGFGMGSRPVELLQVEVPVVVEKPVPDERVPRLINELSRCYASVSSCEERCDDRVLSAVWSAQRDYADCLERGGGFFGGEQYQ